MMKIKESNVTRKSRGIAVMFGEDLLSTLLEVVVHICAGMNAIIAMAMVGITAWMTLLSGGSAMGTQEPFARWTIIGLFTVMCMIGVCATLWMVREIDNLCYRHTHCLVQTVLFWALSPVWIAIPMSLYYGTIEDVVLGLRIDLVENMRMETFIDAWVIYLVSMVAGTALAYADNKFLTYQKKRAISRQDRECKQDAANLEQDGEVE